jgi:lysophospholipase L1-like esterase
MKKSVFEKHSKLVLIVLNLIFLSFAFVILNSKIFQDVDGGEKYSLIDKAWYQIRCEGKRHIKLRENVPNQNSFRIPPYDTSAKYPFKTDENGFVLPSKIHEKADLNIFFLGGSTTECENVDELNRFPYLAGRMLEEKTGKKINSYNAGRSGNSTIHSINNLLNKIVPLQPNIILRMEAVNDLSTLLYEGTYWNKNKTRSNLSCFSKHEPLRNSRNEWDLSPFVEKISDHQHQENIKQEYKKVLRLFVSITRAIGATPVLMTQPNLIENNPNFSTDRGDEDFNRVYRKLYSDFQNVTREVAREENVILIDLAREEDWSRKYIYDSIHLNNEGSKRVAEIVTKHLTKIIK